MIGRLVRVVLALTLFLNGAAAPWAMTLGSPVDATKAVLDENVDDAAANEHRGCHDAPTPAPDEPAPQEPCCKGGVCHCGCVLPLGLPLALEEPGARIAHPAPPVARAHVTPAVFVTAPFRPPAT